MFKWSTSIETDIENGIYTVRLTVTSVPKEWIDEEEKNKLKPSSKYSDRIALYHMNAKTRLGVSISSWSYGTSVSCKRVEISTRESGRLSTNNFGYTYRTLRSARTLEKRIKDSLNDPEFIRRFNEAFPSQNVSQIPTFWE